MDYLFLINLITLNPKKTQNKPLFKQSKGKGSSQLARNLNVVVTQVNPQLSKFNNQMFGCSPNIVGSCLIHIFELEDLNIIKVSVFFLGIESKH